MKCTKCGKENSYRCKCCVGCGTPFSEEEREEGYSKTFWGKVEKLQDLYDILTLSKFLDSRLVRILTLVVIVGFGVFNLLRGGSHLRVEESENYSVEYNQELNASYLLTELDKLPVSLYLPHETEKIVVRSLDEQNQQLEERVYSPEDSILLEAGEADHYLIEADYTKSGTESQLLYLFLTQKGGD